MTTDEKIDHLADAIHGLVAVVEQLRGSLLHGGALNGNASNDLINPISDVKTLVGRVKIDPRSIVTE